MSSRRSRRRKRLSRLKNKEKHLETSIGNRQCNHVYNTRTKTFRDVVSETKLNEPVMISRQSSDSSVIFLGTYRKIPELVILDDSCESCDTKNFKEPETSPSINKEKLVVNHRKVIA